VATHVADEIDQNIDAVSADQCGEPFVSKPYRIVPFVRTATKSPADVVVLRCVRVADELEPMGIMVQDDARRRRTSPSGRKSKGSHIRYAGGGRDFGCVRLPPRELPCVALIPS
jgi:hypothetical protein